MFSYPTLPPNHSPQNYTINSLRYVCCSECDVTSNECNEPTSCLVQPIGAHCCEVMYFGCFGFRVELGFLNCDDVVVVYPLPWPLLVGGVRCSRLWFTSQLLRPSGQQCSHSGGVCPQIQGRQCGAYVGAVEEMMCVVCVDVTEGA